MRNQSQTLGWSIATYLNISEKKYQAPLQWIMELFLDVYAFFLPLSEVIRWLFVLIEKGNLFFKTFVLSELWKRGWMACCDLESNMTL